MLPIPLNEAADVLQNPVKLGKIKNNDTQRFRGRGAEVAVNVKTGKVVAGWSKGEKNKG